MDIQKTLQNMKPRPLSGDERSAMWSKVSAGKRSPFRPFMVRVRLAAAVAAIVLLVGGTALTAAADNAKPGDRLFSVDLASEKIRLALAFGDKKDELRVRFARERLAEVESIVSVFGDTEDEDNNDESDDEENATSTDDEDSSNNDTGEDENEDDDNNEEDNDNIDEDALEQAENAFAFSIEHLIKTKEKLEEDGKETAAQAIAMVIERLNSLAEDHLDRLERLNVRLTDRNDNLRMRVAASSDDLRTRLQIIERRGKVDIELRERSENGRTRIDIEIDDEDQNERDGDEEDDEENDNDDNSDRVTICHIPPGNSNAKRTIRVAEPAVAAHKAHGDTVGECDDEDEEDEGDDDEDENDDEENGDNDDDQDDENDDEDDNTALTISGISANAGDTSAAINWETNRAADSTVWYATSTPLVVTDSTPSVHLTSLTTDHEIELTGLTASTTYYFIVGSVDDDGREATSSEQSFTTD